MQNVLDWIKLHQAACVALLAAIVLFLQAVGVQIPNGVLVFLGFLGVHGAASSVKAHITVMAKKGNLKVNQ